MSRPTAFVAFSATPADVAALAPAVDVITAVIAGAGLEPIPFARLYTYPEEQHRELMDAALGLLRKASVLVAETTVQAIGVGLEIGFAHALSVPVIVVRREGSRRSATVAGVAAAEVLYSSLDELRAGLSAELEVLSRSPAGSPG